MFCYMVLAQRLGSEQPFFGLQSVGLSGEDPQRSIDEMAARYVHDLREKHPDGPYSLGGWSMGGLLALEMAHKLADQGAVVADLVLIDTAPRLDNVIMENVEGATNTELLRIFTRDFLRLGSSSLEIPFEQMPLEAPLSGQMDWLVEVAGEAMGGIDSNTLADFFQVFAANLRAEVDYVPKSYEETIHLFTAETRLSEFPDELDYGWSQFCRDVRTESVGGDHYTLLRPPHVSALAEALRAALSTR